MNRNLMSRTALFVAFLFFAINSYAQDWSDLTDWMRNGGISKLALIAHPVDVNGGISYAIDDINSSRMVIRIQYVETFSESTYTDTYTIERGTFRGDDYFRRIRVSESGLNALLFPAFSCLEDDRGSEFADAYSEIGWSDFFGGTQSFWNLSLSEKAAVALNVYYLQWLYR